MSILDQKRFHSEAAAYAWVESRVWPEGAVCPHCKGKDRVGKMKGKTTRIGLYKCYGCRKPFTVKMGTIFEDSHVKMHIWLQAIYLMSSSKKGISSNQLHRTLGVTLKTAWFMSHRIREAMRSTDMSPMGGGGKFVEIDETFIGRLEGYPKNAVNARGWGYKNAVLSLVERGGKARSFHIADTTMAKIMPIVSANIAKETAVMTDEATRYKRLGESFSRHESVNHSKYEWARGDAYTNTVESYFSVFKRGMRGIYQHCSEKHLHRYLSEYDFRYNNREALGVDDAVRAENAVKGSVGKRLTYRTTNS